MTFQSAINSKYKGAVHVLEAQNSASHLFSKELDHHNDDHTHHNDDHNHHKFFV